MAQDNVLGIQATINGKDIKQGANEFIGEVNRMEKAADKLTTKLSGKARMINGEVKSMGDTFNGLVNTITKGAAAMGIAFSAQQFITQVARTRGEFQQLEVAFNTMLGSAEKAGALMAQLTRTAAITPFGLQEVAGGAKQLLAYGVASEEVNDTLIRLGDIASGLSIPLNDLVYLYGSTMTQGRMFAQDLRQFTGRGIPLTEELAKQFGVTKDKVGELVSAGKVGFEEMRKAIVSMTSEGGKFGGLMEAQSKTIIGQWSNIKDKISTAYNEIGQSSEGVINTALGGLSTLVENYEYLGKAIISVASTYGMYKAVLLVTIALEKAQAVSRLAAIKHTNFLAAATGVLGNRMELLNKGMKANPYVLLATAVVALGTAVWTLHDASSAAEKSQKHLNDSLDEQGKKHKEYKDRIDGLVSSLGNMEVSEGKRIENFIALKQEYPEILKDIKSENEFLSNKHKLLQLINEEQGKQEQKSNQQLLDEAQGRVDLWRSWIEKRGGSNFKVSRDGKGRADMNVLEAISAVETEEIAPLKAKIAQPEVEKYLKNIQNLKDDELVNRLNELTGILQGTEELANNATLKVVGLGGVFSKGQIKTIKDALEVEQESRGTEKKTSNQWLAQYKKEYEEAEKALQSFMSKPTKLSATQFEKERKDLEDKRDAAKKKYEDAGGSAKSDKKEEDQEIKKNRELLAIKRQNQQAEIDLMKEGSEKRIAQINLDYQKEQDAIKEKEAEWKKAQDGKLTEEQKTVLVEWDAKATQTADKLLEDENSNKIKREREAQQALLIQFGNYQEQRKGIEQKYADLREKATSDAEKELLDKQKQAELESVDEKFGYTTTAMADLFEDASQKSVTSIQKIIDKYETLVAFKSGALQEDGTNVTKEELLSLGFSEKDLEALEKGEINIKDVTDAIKALKGELKGKSPWKTFTNDLDDAIDKLKNAKGDSSKIGEGLTGIGNAVTSFAPALKDFGANIGNIFGFDDTKVQSAIDGVAGLGRTAAGVGQIMSGDIVGGAMSAVSGISSVVTAFEGLFGADYSQYNKLVEEYNGLIDVWDKIIDRKREYINIDYGNEARKAGEESLNIINKQIDAYRTLGEERLNAGASIGSHSIGVRQRKAMSQEGWNELQAAAIEIGFNYASVADGRMTGLFKLSAEQLDDLRSKAPTFWAKLDEDVRTYLEKIIESNDQLEETKNLLNEATTGISFDSFYDSFVSTLSDMNADSKDFANDFGEYLKTAILSNLIANKYRGRIQELYDQWANKSDTDGDGIYDLTPEEAVQLKEAQKALADQMIAERDAMAETFGWEDTYSQEATSKGFQTMSQDTGDELKGRFTALQIAGEEIRKQAEQQTVLQTLISTDTAAIRQSVATQQQYISEIVDIQYESVSYLSEISKNTKQLFQMNERLGKIEENTRNI